MTATATDRHGPALDEEGFRTKVRAFLDTHAARVAADNPVEGPELPDVSRLEAARAYQKALFEAGLAALTWPPEYGGQGLPSRFQTIFNEEAADYDIPDGVFTIGFGMCIPTVIAHGSEALKERYVRPSDPGSGDLVPAVLRARGRLRRR